MVDAWGYIESQDLNYTNAADGTGSYLVASPGGFISYFSQSQDYPSSLLYHCYLGFFSFDTTGMTNPDELFINGLNTNLYGGATSATILIAPYDWGSTLTTADWLTPAQLSALTPVASWTYTGTPNVVFLYPLTASLGGVLKYVVYTQEQADGTAPTYGNGAQGYFYNILLALHDFYVDPGVVDAYENEVAADTPGSWWRLEETSGTTAADSSGNGNVGTFVNSPTLGVPGLISGDPAKLAMETSHAGSNYVVGSQDLAGDYSTTGLSFEGIFEFTDLAADVVSYVVPMGIEGNHEIDVEVYAYDDISGAPLVDLWHDFTDNGGSTGQSHVMAPIAGNTPIHIIVTFPPGGLVKDVAMYVNGDRWRAAKPPGHDTYTLTISAEAASNFLGGGDSYSDSMTGTVDELSFYPFELSATRAAIHYKSLAGAVAPTTPTITSISPTSGSTLGGVSVTINGTGFYGTTSVTFGGTPATSYVVNSNIRITAYTPAHAAGLVGVVVTNPAGSDTYSSFTYFVPPDPLPANVIRTGSGAAKAMLIVPIRNDDYKQTISTASSSQGASSPSPGFDSLGSTSTTHTDNLGAFIPPVGGFNAN